MAGDADKKPQNSKKNPLRSRNAASHKPQRAGPLNDYSHVKETDDADAIRKQVEFYLSDHNLPRDKFLFDQVEGSANKAIPLKVIHDFARMKLFQPYSAVVEAIRSSDVLEVNDDEEVSRKIPLDKRFTSDVKANGQILDEEEKVRTLAVKGFPLKLGKKCQTYIEEYFNSFGPQAVRCDRHAFTKHFNGGAYVVFDNEAAVKQALDLETKPEFEYEGESYLLTFMAREDYDKEKENDSKHSRAKSQRQHQHDRKETRDGRGDKGDRYDGRKYDRYDGKKDDRHDKRGRKRSRDDDWSEDEPEQKKVAKTGEDEKVEAGKKEETSSATEQKAESRMDETGTDNDVTAPSKESAQNDQDAGDNNTNDLESQSKNDDADPSEAKKESQ